MNFIMRRIRSLLSHESEAEVFLAIIRTVTLNGIPQLLIWGAVYWYYGARGPAVVLFAWAGMTVVLAVGYFLLPDSLPVLLPLQFAGTMGINAVATYLLGGLVESYGQFLWGLLVPMGALLAYGPRQAIYWFLAYGVLLISLVALSLQTGLSPAPLLLPATIGQLMIALTMFITSTFLFLGTCYFIAKKDHFYDLLRREEEKSENLLLNVLPEEIARVLKDERGTIAASHEDASVMFLDLVGFTPLSERLGPNATVEMLNTIFSAFDDLVDEFGLEKIKTIGDCYMVASGLPNPRDDHAAALVALALELGKVAQAYAGESGESITFRTGVHSGPVTAGVIGKRKFAYDVWGDTVNIASRMESHGIRGKVHISDETHGLIEDQFQCEPRGEIDVKGKGLLRTWIVVGPKNA